MDFKGQSDILSYGINMLELVIDCINHCQPLIH